MKKIIYILCLPVVLLLSSILVACTPNEPSKINVSFDTLKSVVSSEDIDSWQGIDVKKSTISSARTTSSDSTFRSKKNGTSDVSFEHIMGQDNKVYCDNGVRYHKSPNRNYIDESSFDYDDYLEDNVLEGCLSEVESFFNDNNNTSKLVSSKKENDTYKFEINISENVTIICEYTVDNGGNLINIKITISSGAAGSTETDIRENTEVIATPTWFDSDEYKTSMSYEDMRAVVMDTEQYSGWSAIQIQYPSNMMWGELAQNIMVDKDSGYYVVETSEYKEFCDGSMVYRYDAEGNPISVSTVEDATIANEKSYSYTENLQSFISAYQMFFATDAEFFSQFYVAAKKYEKDITIKSFKMVAEAEGYYNDMLCSYYYDLADNIEKVYIYTSCIYDDSPEMSYEKEVEMKMISSVEIPDWFNINDFASL